MTPQAAAARKTVVVILAESAERRAHLLSWLSADSEFEVTAKDAANRNTQPVIVVVDVDSDRASVASALPAARAGVLVLSENQELNWITHTFPGEPVALLSSNCGQKEFLAAMRAVAAGLTVLEPETLESLVRRSPESVALEPGEEELTSRETEVLHMMTAGLTNREIATALGISENTVKFHIASIFGKLGTSTRTETATEGLRRGLILL